MVWAVLKFSGPLCFSSPGSSEIQNLSVRLAIFFFCIRLYIIFPGAVADFVDDRVVICGGYSMEDQEYLAGCQKQKGRNENSELLQ